MAVAIDVTHQAHSNFFKGDAALPSTIARRVYDRDLYLAKKAQRHALEDRDLATELPIGPQDVPDGMQPCVRCDLLTRRSEVCGFCAAEIVRTEAA